MHPEFGRRLRSFLTEGTWWDLIQKLRGEVGKETLWEHIVCGIPQLPAADRQFAQSIDWCVTRDKISLAAVEGYGFQVWWYLLSDPLALNGVLVIQGNVGVVLPAGRNAGDVNARARAFVEAVIDKGHYQDSKPSGLAQKATMGVMNGYEAWSISGKLYVL